MIKEINTIDSIMSHVFYNEEPKKIETKKTVDMTVFKLKNIDELFCVQRPISSILKEQDNDIR